MAEFFPRTTIAWRNVEPHAVRRLTLSLPQMALITGIVLRLWRSYTLTHGSPDSWVWVGGTFLAGAGFLVVMCAIHLANFTFRRWVWRAPAFAMMEASTEIVMSLVLTTLNLEPLGAEMAELADWLPSVAGIYILRLGGVITFTMMLGMVVWVLRRLLLSAESRGRTVTAVHRATAEFRAVQEQGKGENS